MRKVMENKWRVSALTRARQERKLTSYAYGRSGRVCLLRTAAAANMRLAGAVARGRERRTATMVVLFGDGVVGRAERSSGD